ncbi:hypothetical protein INT47_008663 [Mucor saturninus]|uniref:Uncharacterized protein n=1 Tax=Mucor saturninus TaxID=64648 RepID=A0A8H7QJ44_9FUNG|nr:hypothetical protein INT47_008663 [Mucor saturninus]
MEEVYDYSQHRYGITIDLGYDIITSGAVVMNESLWKVESFEKEYKTSLLYDTTTRNIIARDNKAGEANEDPKGLQEGVIYVRNTLSELADMYLKSKQQSFDNTALYALLYEEAIDLLQRILDYYKQELNDYQDTYSMDLKLVSVQYPTFRLAQRKLVPQLLKQAHFVIPFGLKELRLSLIACVEKHCDTTLSSESIDYMLEKLNQEYNGFYNYYLRELKQLYISAEVDEYYPIFDLFNYDIRKVATRWLLDYRMEEFNMRRNPVILPNKESKSCLKPIIFINIDISSTQIQTAYTYLDKGRQVGQKQIFECNMRPLNSFIKQSQSYQRPILRISNRLKLGLEKIFGDYLQLYSSYKRNVKKTIPMSPASELLGWAFRDMRKRSTLSIDERIESNPNLFKELMANIEIDDLFVSKDEFPASDSEPFTTCHPGYMYFFMITYLHCLNKQIEEKLESTVGSKWRANNIWYGVSMDKKLLDTVFGSIKKLEKSFFASGILGKDEELRKAKFCTRGEEILPAIQDKYQHLDFRLKSFFVVAQISSKHIQLSLHQVVKLASPGEDPASIIIQDKMIHINDVYDTLCKSIMKSIQVDCRVDYCITHKSEEDTQYDFQSSEIYSNVYRNLKPCVVEIFEKNKSNLDMDSKIQLDISTKCGCSINILLRDIIEAGLMSVIESITTDIVASLTNKRLFGNYVPNYIFVFGNPFNLGQGSKIHIAYTMIMQKALDDGIYIKEKDTKIFVLRESILQLLDTFSFGKKAYMFESDGDIKNTIAGDDIKLGIIRLKSSTSTVPDKYALLQRHTPGDKFRIDSDYLTDVYLNTVVVEYEQISDNLSIKFSRGCMGDIEDYIDKPYYKTVNIMEPLTLAYI